MAYTTLAQLKKRVSAVVLAMLADEQNRDTSTTALVDTILADSDVVAVIDEAIADADLLINQYVQGVVDITDTAITDQFEPVSACLAIFNLYSRRHNDGEDNPKFWERKEKVKWLEMVGRRQLKLATGPEVPTITAYSSTASRTPVVNDTSVEMY